MVMTEGQRNDGAHGRLVLAGSGERGSVPLALLAMIVASGLITVVVASTLAGERSVRFDQEFTEALHVAEAGIDEVHHLLNTRQLEVADSPATGQGTINGESYKWEATTEQSVGEIGPVTWEVISEGEDADKQTRTIHATIADDPLFNLAAFSDQLLRFSGANNADSYSSETGKWCTGLGRVGSNDALEFSGGGQGQATCPDEVGNATVDGVDLFNWEEDPDPDRCVHKTGTPNNCEDADGKEAFDTHDDPVEFDGDVGWMEALLPGGANADGCTDSIPLVETSDDATAPVTGPGVLQSAPDGTSNYTARLHPDRDIYAYCVDELVFDIDTRIDNPSIEDPVAFLVSENVSVDEGSGAVNVNCEGCVKKGGFRPDEEGIVPIAAALQIYSPSDENPNAASADVVRIRNQSNVAFSAYVPQGSCGGVHGSNASVHLFGSLICSDIRNEGGWQFHYDEVQAGAVRTFDFAVNRWREE